jgi:hypothetical protein
MVKKGSSRQGAQQDGVEGPRCAGVHLVADCLFSPDQAPIYTQPGLRSWASQVGGGGGGWWRGSEGVDDGEFQKQDTQEVEEVAPGH